MNASVQDDENIDVSFINRLKGLKTEIALLTLLLTERLFVGSFGSS